MPTDFLSSASKIIWEFVWYSDIVGIAQRNVWRLDKNQEGVNWF